MPYIFLPVLPHHPPLSPPPVAPNKEAGGRGAVRPRCLWGCSPPPRNPAASQAAGRGRGAAGSSWRARGRGRAAEWPGAPRPRGSACLRAGQGQSLRRAAGATQCHVKVRRSLWGCQELGPLLRGWRLWEVEDDVAAGRSATSWGSDFQLPGTHPKKIIQTKKERCVRKYSQQHKGNDLINLGTSAQWNVFISSGVQ